MYLKCLFDFFSLQDPCSISGLYLITHQFPKEKPYIIRFVYKSGSKDQFMLAQFCTSQITIQFSNFCYNQFIQSMWINVLVLAYNIQIIRRPMNRGHESDSSEWRVAHDWRYWWFGFVDCEVQSYQCNNRLMIITLFKDEASQLMTNRLSNKIDRIRRLKSKQ